MKEVKKVAKELRRTRKHILPEVQLKHLVSMENTKELSISSGGGDFGGIVFTFPKSFVTTTDRSDDAEATAADLEGKDSYLLV